MEIAGKKRKKKKKQFYSNMPVTEVYVLASVEESVQSSDLHEAVYCSRQSITLTVTAVLRTTVNETCKTASLRSKSVHKFKKDSHVFEAFFGVFSKVFRMLFFFPR